MLYLGKGVFTQEVPATEAAQALVAFLERNLALAVVGVTFVPLEMTEKDGVLAVAKGCLTVVMENVHPLKDKFPPTGEVG